MQKYLIDVNLPYYFSLWRSKIYIYQRDIDARMKDSEIWQYAKDNNLTIITKDNNFSDRVIFHIPPPKVIHIKFGNLKMKPFYELISKNWVEICKLSETHKLVNVFENRIEGIN